MAILDEAAEVLEMKLAQRWINKILSVLTEWRLCHDVMGTTRTWYVEKKITGRTGNS